MSEAQQELVLIGLGNRGLGKALQYLEIGTLFKLVAVCDSDEGAIARFKNLYPDVPCFQDVNTMLESQSSRAGSPRVGYAYVAVPHSQYRVILPPLLRHKIHVLKEKPAGLNITELKSFQGLASANNVRLVTAAQSRFGDRWRQIYEWFPLIGELRGVGGTRSIVVNNSGEGWRASKSLAGGGALIDIGWHLVDTVLGLVGDSFTPRVSYSKLIRTRDHETYDCEDTAHIQIELRPRALGPIAHCSLRLTRIAVDEVDEIQFTGSNGVLRARGEHVDLLTSPASGSKIFRAHHPKTGDFVSMLSFFSSNTCHTGISDRHSALREQDIRVTTLIDQIYAHAQGTSVDIPENAQDHRKRSPYWDTHQQDQNAWPRITPDLLEDVCTQAKESLSIYGNHGIFNRFETAFKKEHGCPSWNALLHSSGTNALHSLYFAAGFSPGDEVCQCLYRHLFVILADGP
jgi:predicted dehydrogenase